MKLNSWEMPEDGAVHDWPPTKVQAHLIGQPVELEVSFVRELLWPKAGLRFFARVATEAGDSLVLAEHNETISYALPVEPQTLSDAFNRGKFARTYFFGPNQTLRLSGEKAVEQLLVFPDGRAFWQCAGAPDSSYMRPAAFRWNTPLKRGEFVRSSAHSLWQQIERQLVDPDGETAFARRFARMSEAERSLTIHRFDKGNPAQMEEIIENALRIFGPWHKCQELSCFVWSASQMQLESTNPAFIVADDDISPDLRESLDRIWRYFEPFNPRIQHMECVRDWIGWDRLFFDVEVSKPSAHEQTEAALKWREWLKQSGA